MLISHAVKQRLTVFRIVYGLHGQVFMADFLQSLGYFIHICLILRLITHVCIGRRKLKLTELDGGCLGRKAVAGSGRRQLRQSADVPCVKLRHLNGLIPLQYIKLADLFFNVPVHVIDQIIRLQYAGIHLDQGILADKGIYHGLPDISGFCLGEIIIRVVDLVGLHVDACHLAVFGAGEILHNIVQQRVHTLAQHI